MMINDKMITRHGCDKMHETFQCKIHLRVGYVLLFIIYSASLSYIHYLSSILCLNYILKDLPIPLITVTHYLIPAVTNDDNWKQQQLGDMLYSD